MWFKWFFSALVLLGLLFACSPLKKVDTPAKPEKLELLSSGEDSTEYELLIIDAGFESWFITNKKPVWFYSNEYLETMNLQYVIAWNAKVRDPDMIMNGGNHPFIFEIDYKPFVDYGIELNHKLYHYFRYVESSWGKILPYERRK